MVASLNEEKTSVLEPRSGAAAPAPTFSPLYQQIRQSMLDSMQAGEWKPLEIIPSEMELARRYNVSQGTVRKAIDELAAENLLVRRQGKGTFVASHGEQQLRFRFLRLRPDEGGMDDTTGRNAAFLNAAGCALRRIWRAPCISIRVIRCCRSAECCPLPESPPFLKTSGCPP